MRWKSRISDGLSAACVCILLLAGSWLVRVNHSGGVAMTNFQFDGIGETNFALETSSQHVFHRMFVFIDWLCVIH